MSISPRNLWPEDIAVTDRVPPVSILKEQAALLGQRTKNLVEGRVRSGSSVYVGSDFNYSFELVAPALDNYRYELLRISHGVEFYPLRLFSDPRESLSMVKQLFDPDAQSTGQTIENEGQFLKALEIIFSSEQTRKVIGSLIAQSRAA